MNTNDLRAAVESELVPFMAELGFRRGKRSLAVRPGERSMGPNYQRRRGEDFDELLIQWDMHRRPRFAVNFWTSQIDVAHGIINPKLGDGDEYHCRLKSLTSTRWAKIFGPSRDSWYGDGTDLGGTIATAKARVLQLDRHLRFGEVIKGLGIGNPVMKKADPEVAKGIKSEAPPS